MGIWEYGAFTRFPSLESSAFLLILRESISKPKDLYFRGYVVLVAGNRKGSRWDWGGSQHKPRFKGMRISNNHQQPKTDQ